jgi:prepilin peptidase CpaA
MNASLFPLALPFTFKVLLVVTVLIAGMYDLRYRRIPNRLTLAAAALGLILNALFFHWHGLGSALLGVGIAMLVYFPLYLLRGMGAGDVKLMMAIGAIAGPSNWFPIFVLTALCGAFFGLCLVVVKRRFHQTLLNCYFLLSEMCHLRAPHRTSPQLDVSSSEALRLPHGVSIAVGSIAAVSIHLAG